MRAGVRHLLLDVAIELGALRVGRVAGIDQPGIGGDAADQFLQRLVFAQRLRRAGRPRPVAASAASLPFQRLSNAAASRAARSMSRLQLGRIHAGIEVGEVPFRQVAKRRRAAVPDAAAAGLPLRESSASRSPSEFQKGPRQV